MVFRISAVVILAAVAGCKQKTADSPVDKVRSVRADDKRMNAAIQTARRSVNTFIVALKAPQSGQKGFSVKKAFKQGDKVEHMWLNSVSYDGRVFHGTLNNTPQMVTNVRIGSRVTVDPKELSPMELERLSRGFIERPGIPLRSAVQPPPE